jgi:hypothetical protein
LKKKIGGEKIKMKAKIVLAIGLLFFVSVMMFAVASKGAVAGVVGIWLLDEGKGDIAKDSSGRGHDAEIFDGKWVDGKFNKAIRFENTTHIEVPDHKDFHFTKTFTVELWANIEDLPKDHVGIPGKGHDAAVGSFVFHPTKLGAKEFELRFYISQGGNWPATKTGAIPFGEWHHLAGTYDGAELRIYIDGELEASQAQKGKINVSEGAPFKFAYDCCGDRNLIGILDEIRISNIAQPEDEIKKSMGGLESAAVELFGKLATSWGEIKK